MVAGGVLLLAGWAAMRQPETDPSALAGGARALEAAAVDPHADGQVVSVTGPLTALQQLGDPGLLRPGDYVEIWRDVEVFAWYEVAVAPGVYRYQPRWGKDPPATAEMHEPQGHDNPPVLLRSDVLSADAARVGAYRFSPRRARLPGEPLRLQPELMEQEDRRHRLSGSTLYIGNGTEEAPFLGDLRVRYSVLRAGQAVTLFGEQHGGEIVPAYSERGTRLYHLGLGGPREALAALPRLSASRPALLSP